MSRQQLFLLPYLTLGTILLISALLFGISLCRSVPSPNTEPSYVLGFNVYADGGNAVRIVPLAGTVLRSPIVTIAEAPLRLSY